MEKKSHVYTYLIFICSAIIFIFGDVHAQISKDVAIVLKSTGKVRVKKTTTRKWHQGRRGLRLDSGDIIKTFENSLAAVMFTDDKTLLKVRNNSIMAIRGKRKKNSITKRVICTFGNFWLKVKKQKSELVVETPSGVAAVKGTEFYGMVEKDGSLTIVAIEGIIQLMNDLGKVLVKAGETGKLTKDGQPYKYKSKANEKQDWGGEEPSEKELKFEFQDEEGNKKELKIKYQEK